jgi:hypothetical protein
VGLTYFKRYRMEMDLSRPLFPTPALDDEYVLEPWSEELVEAHAEAKYQSFCFELDANLFPCLGDRDGCRRLMQEIASREGFVPEATWLLVHETGRRRSREFCGTVQGVRDSNGYGAIQNLGVTPNHRDRGLGSAKRISASRFAARVSRSHCSEFWSGDAVSASRFRSDEDGLQSGRCGLRLNQLRISDSKRIHCC